MNILTKIAFSILLFSSISNKSYSQTWEKIWESSGNTIGITGLVGVDDVLYAATTKGIYKSIDWGKTWNSTSPYTHGMNNIFYIGGNFYVTTIWYGMYRSSDGINWTQLFYWEPYTEDLFSINNILYTWVNSVSSTSIYKSTDNGVTWSQEGPIIPDGINTNAVCTDNIYIYAGVNTKGVYRYDFNTQLWELKSNGMSSTYIHHLYSSNSMVITSVGPYLEISKDRGETWTKTSLPMYCYNFFIKGDTVIWNSSYDKVTYTYDNGTTWFNKVNDGYIQSDKRVLVYKDTLYAFGYSLWKICYSEIVTPIEKRELKKQTIIGPNPFVNQIIIQSDRSFNQIRILDLKGNSLVDKTLMHNTYSQNLDLLNINTGVYQLNLLSDGEVIHQEKLIRMPGYE